MDKTSHGLVLSLMLAVPQASAAAAWYKTALGATELWKLGTIVGLELDGSPLFLFEPTSQEVVSPTRIGATTARVEVFVDDPDAFIERAIAAGATAGADGIQNHHRPWGIHRQGGFTDPFGHVWLVGDKSPLQTRVVSERQTCKRGLDEASI